MRFSRKMLTTGALLLTLLVSSNVRGAEPDPALRSYHAANGFLNRGMNELAAREYEAFLEQRPDHENAPTARYGLGVAQFRMNQLEACVTTLTPLLKVQDFEFATETDLLIGQAQLTTGMYAPAAERFEAIVKRDRNHASAPAAGALLVESLYRADDAAGAERAADSFLRRWSQDERSDRVQFFFALAAMSDERYDVAADRFETLLETTPKSSLAAQSTLLAAQCRQQEGALAQAARFYEHVIEQANDALMPDALFGLATILQSNGQPDDAALLLDEFLRRSPDDARVADAKLRRAQIWFGKRRYDRAESLLTEVSQLDNADDAAVAYWQAKCALRSDEPQKAAQLLATAIDASADHTLAPEMNYDLAVALERAGEIKDARRALEQFERRYSDHALASEALALHASLAHQLGDYTDSAAACQTFLESNRNHPQAPAMQYLLAENFYLNGELSDAAEAFEIAIKTSGDSDHVIRATFRLGVIRYQQGKYGDAAPLLTRVLTEAPKNEAFTSASLMLGEIEFANRNWKGAASSFEQYIANRGAPDIDQALLKLGIARQRQDDLTDALRAFDQLLRDFSTSDAATHAQFERGQILLVQNETDEAVEAFEYVIKADDADRFLAPALNHLGAIAAQRNDHDAAIEHLTRAAEVTEDDALRAETLNRLGRSLAANGRSAEAAATFAALHEEQPDNRYALESRARQALALAKAGDSEQALALIEEIERNGVQNLDPRLLGALRYEKAWRLRESGRSGDAANAYRVLLAGEIDESLRVHALIEAADLDIAASQFDRAATALREALALLEPGRLNNPALRAGAQYRLGLALHRTGSHNDAAELLNEYLRSDHIDDSLIAAANLMAGESLYQLGRHRAAATCFSSVVEASDDDEQIASSLLRLGECEAAGQKWAASERAFADYLDRFSEQSLWFQARFGQGWSRENLGRHDDAIDAYREVVNRHEGQTAARAQFQIGECLFAQRKLQDAVAEFLKVDLLYAYPQWSAAALYEAGRCFEALGQPAEARRQFERVQTEFSDTQWAPMAASRLAAAQSNSLPAR